MLGFYKKAALAFFCLVSLTLLLAWFCISRFFVSDALFPAATSTIPWKFETVTDAFRGGSSSVSVIEDVYSLDYEYHLTEKIMFPYVVAVMAFENLDIPNGLVDLSKYSTATYRVKCSQNNVMTFYILGFDEKVTIPGDFYTYRIAEKVFSCNDEWSEIEIDLRYLSVPAWWLETFNLEIADQQYSLDRAFAIAFDASRKGPLNTSVRVRISELVLHGQDWRFVWGFSGISAAIWIFYIVWLLRQYTLSLLFDVKERLKKDRPLIAYQQLSIEPHRDEEKSRVLRFMATEYADPEMSLEYAISKLGINRTKINELLKDELGLTFSSYLNRLRLAEAARLLASQEDANIAEIAYSVGYNNVSYFNKLFKSEYGCTPRTFKILYESKTVD